MFAGARDRKQICPHSVEKFDLRSRRGSFVPRLTPGAGCCRCKACAWRFREGDAPAGCRGAGARCPAAHGRRWTQPQCGCVTRRSIGRAMRAPYGVKAADAHGLARRSIGRAMRAPLGQQPTFAYPFGRPGSNTKAPLTFTREARPEGKGVIRKRGETFGVSPLVRLPRAAALSVC